MEQRLYLKRIQSGADTAPRYVVSFDPPVLGVDDSEAVDCSVERDSRIGLIHKAVSLLEARVILLSEKEPGEPMRVCVASDHDFFADSRRPQCDGPDRDYLESILSMFGEKYRVEVVHFAERLVWGGSPAKRSKPYTSRRFYGIKRWDGL